MLKKVINYREVNLLIQEKLRNGISRSQILSQLSEIYYEKKTLARLIAMNVSPQKRANYRSLNNLLLGLVFMSLVLKCLFSFAILAPNPFGYFAVVVLLINTFMFVSVFNYNGSVYGMLVLTGIMTLIKVLPAFESMNNWALLDVAVTISGVALAYYLKVKMFPQLGWIMPKEGDGGKIILGE